MPLDINNFDIFRWGHYSKNFKFYVLIMTIFCEKGGDIIQGRTLDKRGHYLRKYGIFFVFWSLQFVPSNSTAMVCFYTRYCRAGRETTWRLKILNGLSFKKSRDVQKSARVHKIKRDFTNGLASLYGTNPLIIYHIA